MLRQDFPALTKKEESFADYDGRSRQGFPNTWGEFLSPWQLLQSSGMSDSVGHRAVPAPHSETKIQKATLHLMALNVRHPIWLPAAPRPGIRVFAWLTCVEAFARATISTAIPIQALELFHNEQTVSFVYTGVGLFALSFTFVIPFLIRITARRFVYTAGALGLVAASACFMLYTQPGQAAGMTFRVLAVACLNVTLNLYILDHVRREQFVRNDAVRLTAAMVAWTVGPYLGVLLYTEYGPWAPFALSCVFSAALIALFWYFRLSDNRAIMPARTQPKNPFLHVGRFVSQPRLRLAWLIAFSRSAFWTTFFVYGPILMVLTGEGKEAGGILVSAGNALMIFNLFWGRLGERIGVRKVATLAFLIAAVVLVAAGIYGQDQPWTTAGLLLLATFFIVPLDVVGGSVFYRAVRIHERPEMTAIYRTYLDASDLIPPMVYGILLGLFGLGVVFIALGIYLSVVAFVCWRHIPRRL